MRRFAFLAATAVIFFATSHPAGAVSIVVTDGFLEQNSNAEIWFELQSDTHTISCSAQLCGDFIVRTPDAGGIRVGTAHTATPSAFVRPGNAPLIVNGIAFPRPVGVPGFGTFDFSVGPFTMPPAGPFGTGMVETPFTFTGNLNAVNPEGSILDLSLTGQGRSRLFLDFGGSSQDFGFIRKYSFSFTDGTGGGPGAGPGVIPEPSTVLLVASGLAGLGLWRRSNKHRVA